MKLEEYKAENINKEMDIKLFYQVVLIITGDGMIRN